MYSPAIIQDSIDKYEFASNIPLIRYPVELCDEWVDHLNTLIEDGVLKRALTPEELRFVENEIVMSRLDFQYWAERYCWFIDKSSKPSRFLPLWESQRILLRLIGRLQDKMADMESRGEPTLGIRIVLHKARQLGATMICQGLLVHRCNFTPNVRSLIASASPNQTLRVFARAERIWKNLPYWMRGRISEKAIERGMTWGDNDSSISLQSGSQISGVGQGDTWDVSHLTECSSWPYTDSSSTIENDFFPAIAESRDTLSILESTAQRLGDWWNNFTEQARSGDAPEWTYKFIPWYIEGSRYILTPPVDWVPTPTTLAHAKLIEETSAEFTEDGSTYIPSRDQLFWYEEKRRQYYNKGVLNVFLANWCATPEESFQHASEGAFTTEQIAEITEGCETPLGVYRLHGIA